MVGMQEEEEYTGLAGWNYRLGLSLKAEAVGLLANRIEAHVGKASDATGDGWGRQVWELHAIGGRLARLAVALGVPVDDIAGLAGGPRAQ